MCVLFAHAIGNCTCLFFSRWIYCLYNETAVSYFVSILSTLVFKIRVRHCAQDEWHSVWIRESDTTTKRKTHSIAPLATTNRAEIKKKKKDTHIHRHTNWRSSSYLNEMFSALFCFTHIWIIYSSLSVVYMTFIEIIIVEWHSHRTAYHIHGEHFPPLNTTGSEQCVCVDAYGLCYVSAHVQMCK